MQDELSKLTHTIAQRVGRYLERRDLLECERVHAKTPEHELPQ